MHRRVVQSFLSYCESIVWIQGHVEGFQTVHLAPSKFQLVGIMTGINEQISRRCRLNRCHLYTSDFL
jgi:hypothetical protein